MRERPRSAVQTLISGVAADWWLTYDGSSRPNTTNTGDASVPIPFAGFVPGQSTVDITRIDPGQCTISVADGTQEEDADINISGMEMAQH
jgi:hypothetical protein